MAQNSLNHSKDDRGMSTSKLFSLKEWLTVPETAKHLSILFGEDVTEVDVLRLALDGHITMSVRLINAVPARRCNFKSETCTDEYDVSFTRGYWEVDDSPVEHISGFFDLPLKGDETVHVEHRLRKLVGEREVDSTSFSGSYVAAGGLTFQLQEMIVCSRIGSKAEGGIRDPINYEFTKTFPPDGMLVVRTEALREYELSINSVQSIPERPIATNERNTLLLIIAALCDHSAIKHQERGAASQIARLTEEIGAVVTDDTVRKVLAKIPGALETRMK
jgi:hypothetical protein